MNGDALTILVGVAGIVVSGATYRLSARAADKQQHELHLQLEQRGAIVSTLTHSAGDRTATAVMPAPRLQPGPAERLSGAAGDADSAVSPSALELLVRASLGALLDERGQVQLSRLFQEVGETLGAPHYHETVQILRQLREAGAIDWEGPDDLSEVQTVRVLMPQRSDSAIPGTQVAGDLTR